VRCVIETYFVFIFCCLCRSIFLLPYCLSLSEQQHRCSASDDATYSAALSLVIKNILHYTYVYCKSTDMTHTTLCSQNFSRFFLIVDALAGLLLMYLLWILLGNPEVNCGMKKNHRSPTNVTAQETQQKVFIYLVFKELGVFRCIRKMWKSTLIFIISICLCPHGMTRFPLNRFL